MLLVIADTFELNFIVHLYQGSLSAVQNLYTIETAKRNHKASEYRTDYYHENYYWCYDRTILISCEVYGVNET
jgi:hypothetical protein